MPGYTGEITRRALIYETCRKGEGFARKQGVVASMAALHLSECRSRTRSTPTFGTESGYRERLGVRSLIASIFYGQKRFHQN